MPETSTSSTNGQGKRAEEVASWYFRLNGFLQIPGFVLHSDVQNRQITDADLLGIRFPYSCESLRGIRMTDDRWISQRSQPNRILMVIAEVKVAACRINGPWTNVDQGGMERIINRLGFLPNSATPEIARCMYNNLHWEDENYCLQYVVIGRTSNHGLRTRYPRLQQLTWEEVAAFIFERFDAFGEIKGIPDQWPDFAKQFARAVTRQQVQNSSESLTFTTNYISGGLPE